jgi:hypothetical protein
VFLILFEKISLQNQRYEARAILRGSGFYKKRVYFGFPSLNPSVYRGQGATDQQSDLFT